MVAGKAPALIFVVRHGARLDAADKEWHLTSPTPYDPPLTYGGWTQCRALGARIASILLAREAAYVDKQISSMPTTKSMKQKRMKHRIITHSSPFLRCTQTSIAIAAGMSQFHGIQNEIRAQQKTANPKLPPRTRSMKHKEPNLETIADTEPSSIDLAPLQVLPIKPLPKTRLRLDAFLGEWFSPEYYEHITHPPNSILMLAGAKAELLHRGESLEGVVDSLDVPSRPNFFPGGWGSPNTQPGTPETDIKDKELQLPQLDRLKVSRSPTRDRATTVGSAVDNRRLITNVTKALIGGYTPPTPRYAILPTDPIPKGYTAHAREACIDVDYAWDSTRPPHNWGDGGEYGEEWSSMHKRFRSGISRMVSWYRLHHESPYMSNGHKRALHPVHEEDTDEDCEVDTVLILVTHGAGCNALIGALTDQPVLMDVAMASLTMAERKDLSTELNNSGQSDTSSPRSSSPRSPISSRTEGSPLSHEYNVLITASVDHLRAGTNPLSIPILQNPSLAYESLFSGTPNQSSSTNSYVAIPRYRMNHSTMITSSPIDRPTQDLPRPAGLMYGGIQRSVSAAARSGGTSSSGLWNVPETRRTSEQLTVKNSTQSLDHEEATDEQVDESDQSLTRIVSGVVLDLKNSDSKDSASSKKAPPVSQSSTPGLWPPRETGNLVTSSPGLWSARVTSNIPSGPPTSIPLEVSERSIAAKRRWTVNENRAE